MEQPENPRKKNDRSDPAQEEEPKAEKRSKPKVTRYSPNKFCGAKRSQEINNRRKGKESKSCWDEGETRKDTERKRRRTTTTKTTRVVNLMESNAKGM